MTELDNPILKDPPISTRPKVFKVRVEITMSAIIEVTADDEDYIDDIIDDYTDSVIAEADNAEVSDWEVLSVEDWEADYD